MSKWEFTQDQKALAASTGRVFVDIIAQEATSKRLAAIEERLNNLEALNDAALPDIEDVGGILKDVHTSDCATHNEPEENKRRVIPPKPERTMSEHEKWLREIAQEWCTSPTKTQVVINVADHIASQHARIKELETALQAEQYRNMFLQQKGFKPYEGLFIPQKEVSLQCPSDEAIERVALQLAKNSRWTGSGDAMDIVKFVITELGIDKPKKVNVKEIAIKMRPALNQLSYSKGLHPPYLLYWEEVVLVAQIALDAAGVEYE